MAAVIHEYRHAWHYFAPFSQADVKSTALYETCPVCDGASPGTALVHLGNPDWPERIRLVQCPDCDTIHYQNPPSEDRVADYYRKVWNTKDGESAASGERPKLKASKRFAKLLGDLNYQKKDAAILDVGCGVGNLMAGLAAAGFANLWGAEMSPYRVGVAERRFPGRIFSEGYAGVPDEMRFDIIYANHVLEHLHHPAQALDWMKTHLTDDGIIILSCPDAWCEQVSSQVLFLPHIFSFCHKSFERLAARNAMTALFWNNDRYGDMTCVIVKERQAFRPAEGAFSRLAELKRRTGGDQQERLRAPWVGGGPTRHLLVRGNRKGCAPAAIEKGFHSLSDAELSWLKLRWRIGDLLGALGLRSFRRKLLYNAAYLKLSPQREGGVPTVMNHDGEGVFDIK